MKLKRRVSLGGVQLDSVDDRIVITGVEPGDGRENISATETAAGFGQRITQKRRTTLDVVVRFRILEHGRSVDGMTERSQVLEKVNAWAAPGGYLRFNYKPNRRLGVILAQAPGEGSLWDYSKEFAMTFRAYTVPYWEDSDENSEKIGGNVANATKSIKVEGSAQTQCNVELANKSGMKIDKVTVTVGSNTMSFTALGLAGNEALVIDHRNALVRIRIRNSAGSYRNVMSKRTGANDMTADPGTVSCGFKADRACQMNVTWRNRYL